VEEALVEMYLAGVSVRRVEDITEALWGTRVSSGTVSRLSQKIYRHIEAWRNREVVGEFPYLYLDGPGWPLRSNVGCSQVAAHCLNQVGQTSLLGNGPLAGGF